MVRAVGVSTLKQSHPATARSRLRPPSRTRWARSLIPTPTSTTDCSSRAPSWPPSRASTRSTPYPSLRIETVEMGRELHAHEKGRQVRPALFLFRPRLSLQLVRNLGIDLGRAFDEPASESIARLLIAVVPPEVDPLENGLFAPRID